MKKNIGIMGLTFDSSNKGCMALACSFASMLKEFDKNDEMSFTIFATEQYDVVAAEKKLKHAKLLMFRLKQPQSLGEIRKAIGNCDVVFDFTEGDSFSDIYGIKRMIKVSMMKDMVIRQKKPLVLCPQTYGPYNSVLSKKIARKIFKKAYFVCSRDELSANVVKDLAGRNIPVYCDVALGLPSDQNIKVDKNKTNIGINVSALLWSGGYNGQNQFELKTDYPQYCRNLITGLLAEKKYDVHLIPHVYSENMPEVENDYLVCLKVKQEFPETILAPMYSDPEQIKGYISQMDYFIGARMHSTIAAFSTGVVTIPFSYSHKFEGLYGTLEYPYVIRAREMDTKEALDITMEYINNSEPLIHAQKKSQELIETRLRQFKEKVEEILVKD